MSRPTIYVPGYLCKVEECDRQADSLEFCRRHYMRFHRYGSAEDRPRRVDVGGPLERFIAKRIVQEDGCWGWKGAVNGSGYSLLVLNGKSIRAHRWSYENWVGPIPEGFHIDHLCRNRYCTNPEHLEAVSHRENLLRGKTIAARNSAKTHCKNGHEYTEANTKITNEGARSCRACMRMWSAQLSKRRRNGETAPRRPSAIERFIERRTIRPDGCWDWTGTINGGGYAAFHVGRKIVAAHRWSYEYWIGGIPEGMQIDHLCRNKWCTNPNHLEAVTPSTNVWRIHHPVEVPTSTSLGDVAAPNQLSLFPVAAVGGS